MQTGKNLAWRLRAELRAARRQAWTMIGLLVYFEYFQKTVIRNVAFLLHHPLTWYAMRKDCLASERLWDVGFLLVPQESPDSLV